VGGGRAGGQVQLDQCNGSPLRSYADDQLAAIERQTSRVGRRLAVAGAAGSWASDRLRVTRVERRRPSTGSGVVDPGHSSSLPLPLPLTGAAVQPDLTRPLSGSTSRSGRCRPPRRTRRTGHPAARRSARRAATRARPGVRVEPGRPPLPVRQACRRTPRRQAATRRHGPDLLEGHRVVGRELGALGARGRSGSARRPRSGCPGRSRRPAVRRCQHPAVAQVVQGGGPVVAHQQHAAASSPGPGTPSSTAVLGTGTVHRWPGQRVDRGDRAPDAPADPE